MEATEFVNYTERLQMALEAKTEVLGLVTLGTTADPTFRDKWSDHDFWVITSPGAQNSLVKDLSWLPDYHDIAISVSHGENRRTLLYRNQHKVEFAVFDVDEARGGRVERYQVLLDRGQVAGLMQSVHQEGLKQIRTQHEGVQNLCLLVWSACERYSRGELLSARQYLDGFAVNQLLSLVSAETRAFDASTDALDPRRRLELRSPSLAEEVLATLNQTVPEAALHLLEIVQRKLKPQEPTLPWTNVTMVENWIRALTNG